MSKKEKLLQRLRSKPKPKDFTYYEAKAILNNFGFVEDNKGKTSGSRIKAINRCIRRNGGKLNEQYYELQRVLG